VVYLLAVGDEQISLVYRLGKHMMGKSFLYFRQLADIEESVLEKLVAGSVADVKRRYG
jgi:hypothetical protein